MLRSAPHHHPPIALPETLQAIHARRGTPFGWSEVIFFGCHSPKEFYR